MSTEHKNDEEIVNDLVREAKSAWTPKPPSAERVDELDRKLFARLDAYDRSPATRSRSGADPRFWGSVGLITAVAAAALFFARPQDDASVSQLNQLTPPPTTHVATSVAPRETPSPAAPAELTAVNQGGELRADGVHAALHHVDLHNGQRLEARGGDAVFAAPGRVDWVLERGTEVSMVQAGAQGGPIILALQVGAIEAQVVPVVTGEAFAIDVDGVRVAVHGTHFRVAREERNGKNVVVDLSEGVISVGAPADTLAQRYNAPAHVEFSVSDLVGTLHVDHDPGRVRAAVDPVALAALAQSVAPESAPESAPSSPVTSQGSGGNAPVVSSRTLSATPPKPPTPNELIVAAVRRCAGETLHGGAGTITISSMLTVDVTSDGKARLATFHPPLMPELQSCIGKVVYETSWSEPGAHDIPIELHL